MANFKNPHIRWTVEDGAGADLAGYDLSGLGVTVEDYADNIWGAGWANEAEGNPAMLGFFIRMTSTGLIAHYQHDCVVYAHDDEGLGHLFLTRELIDPGTGASAYEYEGFDVPGYL